MLNFLTCMARNLPEHYACHPRRKICLIDYKFDRMSGRTCRAPYTVSPLELVDGNPFFEIAYAHFQLVLKCWRIFGSDDANTRPQLYVRRFLAPHHRTVRYFEGSLTVLLSVYPRIVDGRFLLFNEWQIEKEDHKVCTKKGIHGHILVCRHQEYSQDAWLLPPGEVPEAGALCEAFRLLALHPPDAVAHGSCATCNTDFAVQGTRNRCRLRSWQDFGREGDTMQFWAFLPLRGYPASHHKPGSVRQLYESGEGGTYVCFGLNCL